MKPVSRRELIRVLRTLGFSGPVGGSKHPAMVKGQLRAMIPNEHGEDVGVELLHRILKRAQIELAEWERAIRDR